MKELRPKCGRATCLAKSISELGLSERAVNCIRSAMWKKNSRRGLYSEQTPVYDLIQLTEDDLLAVRNCGKVTLLEIRTALAKQGTLLGLDLGFKPTKELKNKTRRRMLEEAAAFLAARGFTAKELVKYEATRS